VAAMQGGGASITLSSVTNLVAFLLVGRCRLSVSKSELKARLVSALEM